MASTLTHETVQWDCLFEIIHPRRKVRVRVCLGEPNPTQEKETRKAPSATPIQTQVNERRNPLIDVRLGREVVWLASVVDIIRVLVYSDVIHRHDRRERQMFEIDGSEVGRHSQVKDEILEIRKTSQQREVREWVRDKGGRKSGHAP